MITLQEAQGATGGAWLARPLPPHTPLYGGAFDTRLLGDGEIFFALRGESGDGHDYLHQLIGSGVRLAVVERPVVPDEFAGAVLQVNNSGAALRAMAAALVHKYKPYVVAVTGSYGKTTAKEIIAHVLAGGRAVLKTPDSFNNEIGVPLTLLHLDGSQQAVVLEFAARNVGDIDQLGAIAPPHVAVLLNVGRAHVGIFGSRDEIYRAKGEIFNHLRPGGLALINAEDQRLASLAAGHRVLTFGREIGDYRAETIATDHRGRISFTGVSGEHRLNFRAGFSGPHAVYPLLAAWAVAHEAGLTDGMVAARAGHDPQQKGRNRLITAPGGATVVDDTYNASPETVINVIHTLAAMEEPEKVLVLGHLSEMEDGLDESARVIGEGLRPPLGELWVYDPQRPETAGQLEALAQGVSVRRENSLATLITELRKLDRPGVAIGIKGSRSSHMERVVLGLQGSRVVCSLTTCPLLLHCGECPQLTGA
ncbi:MAG: UDP-N-acetylmuramoyl-tripeptide--D-alanyl-D-alanine ligase [SAR324 cluster bacterium]|nr:UDP-N-acetylmuramoyl-tripeptide--D-alanyl-D-alanine ligase [SAR324 cluster bacterium]